MSGKSVRRPKLGDIAAAKKRAKELYERRRTEAENGKTEMLSRAALQPHIYTGTVDSTDWKDLVSVSASGRLTALGVAGGPRYHYFQIEIDGTVVATDFLAGNGLPGHVNNGMGVDLPFSKQLVVRARDGQEGSSIAKYWIAWVTEVSQLLEEETTLRYVDGMEYRFLHQLYGRADESTYGVDSLLGPRLVSEARLDRDWTLMEGTRGDGYIQLGGDVVVRDLVEDQEERVGEAPTLIHVAGRRSVVGEVRLAGGESVSRTWIPAPGEYSITPALEGCSNQPAFFTVL